MLNSKSKQVGFVGTLLFHLVIFLLCLLSSIGYTSIEPPVGIEIQFVTQELEIIDKLNNTLNLNLNPTHNSKNKSKTGNYKNR